MKLYHTPKNSPNRYSLLGMLQSPGYAAVAWVCCSLLGMLYIPAQNVSLFYFEALHEWQRNVTKDKVVTLRCEVIFDCAFLVS